MAAIGLCLLQFYSWACNVPGISKLKLILTPWLSAHHPSSLLLLFFLKELNFQITKWAAASGLYIIVRVCCQRTRSWNYISLNKPGQWSQKRNVKITLMSHDKWWRCWEGWKISSPICYYRTKSQHLVSPQWTTRRLWEARKWEVKLAPSHCCFPAIGTEFGILILWTWILAHNSGLLCKPLTQISTESSVRSGAGLLW